MTVSFVARAALAGAVACAGIVLAQAPGPGAAPDIVPLDRVVAVVNDEALTQWDLREQKRVLLEQLKASNVPAPATDVLDKQVLERLITERALTQFAKETGIRVDDTTVERTILRIAEENKLSADEFRKVLAKENIPYANYREDIRRQVIMQRLRDRAARFGPKRRRAEAWSPPHQTSSDGLALLCRACQKNTSRACRKQR